MSIYHATCQGYHDTVAEARRCQGVGYGGQPLPPASPAPRRVPIARDNVPATPPQVGFIHTLAAEKVVPVAGRTEEEANLVERLFDLSGWRGVDFDPEHDKFVGKREASNIITWLKTLPRKEDASAKATGPKPEVPAGRYALTSTDGVVRFYQVDRPTEGRWAGYTFTKALIGSPGDWRRERLNRAVEAEILRAIEKDVEGAARLFGRKTETCGWCSSPLSTPQSRAAGYGETCAGNHGYWYPSLKEALEILEELAPAQ